MGCLHCMKAISKEDIESWERFYRANFINCLTGFKPVCLIGSMSDAGIPNLAVFSSIIHLGSNPALVGYINRPVAAARDTIENIRATGVYTINHIHPDIVGKAHQTSAKYPAEINEFEAVSLEAAFTPGFAAPYVAASKVRYGLQLEEIVPIKQNDTFLVIGSIQHIYIDPSVVQPDGFLALEQARSLASLGNDAYYETVPFARLPYAKAR